MEANFEACEKLLQDGKYFEARELAVELMYDFPADVRSNLLVFHASLPIGDDIFARGALKSLHSLGYGKEKISTEYELLKFLRETRMEMKKAYAGAKYEESLKAAKIGLEVAPFSREFQVHKAKCFIRLNMPIVAKGIIEKLIVDDPENMTLIYLQGVLKFYFGQLEEALSLVNRACENADLDDRKYVQMRFKIERFLQPVRNAKKLALEKNFLAEIDIYTKEIESPNVHFAWCFELLILRANAHKNCSNFRSAIIDINRALSLPNVYHTNEKHLELRAQCYFAKEDWECCIIDCQAVLKSGESEMAKSLMEKAVAKEKVEQIVKKIEKGELKEAYSMSYQLYQETRKGDFFIFAIQCAREMKDIKTVVKLLESIKNDGELLDIAKISLGQYEEEIMTTPKEFTAALTYYDEGNFGNCIEVLTAAKREGVSKEKFPQLTMDKAKKTLRLIHEAADLQKEKKFDEAVKILNEAMTIEPTNKTIQQKLLFCRGRLHFDAKSYKEALSDFLEIPTTSILHEKIEEMRKTCIKEIGEHEQKLNGLCQKARRMSLAKKNLQSME